MDRKKTDLKSRYRLSLNFHPSISGVCWSWLKHIDLAIWTRW